MRRFRFAESLRYQFSESFRKKLNQEIAKKCINCPESKEIATVTLKTVNLDGTNYVTGGDLYLSYVMRPGGGGLFQKTGSGNTPIKWGDPTVWRGTIPSQMSIQGLQAQAAKHCSNFNLSGAYYYRAKQIARQKCIDNVAKELSEHISAETSAVIFKYVARGSGGALGIAGVLGFTQCTPTAKGSSIEFPECQYEATLNVVEQQGFITDPETGQVYEANGAYADSYCQIGTIAMNHIASTPGPPIAMLGGPGKYRLNKITYRFAGFRTDPTPYGEVVRFASQERIAESPGPWKNFSQEDFQGRPLYYNWGGEDTDITPNNAGYTLPAEAFRGGACPTSPEQSAATLAAMLEIAYTLLNGIFPVAGLALESVIQEAGAPPTSS